MEGRRACSSSLKPLRLSEWLTKKYPPGRSRALHSGEERQVGPEQPQIGGISQHRPLLADADQKKRPARSRPSRATSAALSF